jgi:hypothetical protein
LSVKKSRKIASFDGCDVRFFPDNPLLGWKTSKNQMRKLDFLENLVSLYENLRKKTNFSSISYVKNGQNRAKTRNNS